MVVARQHFLKVSESPLLNETAINIYTLYMNQSVLFLLLLILNEGNSKRITTFQHGLQFVSTHIST